MNVWFAASLLSMCAAAVCAKDLSRFEPGPAMTAARAGHSATLLDDGRVLVVGGEEPGRGDSGAELYDPVHGRFLALAATDLPAGPHSSTRLADGRILFAGGHLARPRSAFVFDPATLSFTRAGDMHSPQAGHAAARLADGRVLLAGGLRSTSPAGIDVARAELFDPATLSFSVVADYATTNSLYPPAQGAVWPTATTLDEGYVLIAGNLVSEYFDPVARLFVRGPMLLDPHLPFGRYWHSATPLADGSVLIAGGAEVEATGVRSPLLLRFDPVARSFETVATMRAGRSSHSATRLRDGSVLIAGGETWQNDASGTGWFGGRLATTERFDPVAMRLRPDAPMSAARSGYTATLLRDGRVLIAGGIGDGVPQRRSSTEFYVGASIGCGHVSDRSRCLAKAE